MVHFGVVADDVIDFFRVDHRTDIGQELISKRPFNRVNEGYFFVNDQIGVIGGALIGRIAMKIPDIPISHAHFENSIRYFNGFHCSLLFKNYYGFVVSSLILSIMATDFQDPYPSRHPPHRCMPSFSVNLDAMVGSPQRRHGFDGSI